MSEHLPYEIDPDQNRHHFYETNWKTIALDLLEKKLGSLEGLSLLDFGSGRGETMNLGAKRGMLVTGTDTDPECVSRSAKFGKAEVLNTADPVGQFGENSFDVVACFHVLEHVPSPIETLSAISKIAKKHVLLAVPNLSAFHDLVRPSKWCLPVNKGHLQSWDHSHFKNLAEEHCRLKIEEWAHDAVIVPPISNLIVRFFGQKAAIKVETEFFNKIHPFASLSIIAYATPVGGGE